MQQASTLQVNGLTLEYTLSGRKDRPVVAFIHGLAGDMSLFAQQMEYFQCDYRVLLFSLRGHGDSSRIDPPSLEAYGIPALAGDALALLDQLGFEAVHWVGHSMGGLIGFQILQDAPDRVLSLATFGITAYQRYSPALVAVMNFSKALLIRIMGYERFYRWASSAVSKSPAVQRKVADMAMAADPQAAHYSHMNLAHVDYLDTLAQSRIPLLLIRCEHDKAVNQSLSSTLAILDAEDHARIIHMPGVGHYASLEQPELFNRVLEDWLKEQE